MIRTKYVFLCLSILMCIFVTARCRSIRADEDNTTAKEEIKILARYICGRLGIQFKKYKESDYNHLGEGIVEVVLKFLAYNPLMRRRILVDAGVYTMASGYTTINKINTALVKEKNKPIDSKKPKPKNPKKPKLPKKPHGGEDGLLPGEEKQERYRPNRPSLFYWQ